jgi:hypothetical protein
MRRIQTRCIRQRGAVLPRSCAPRLASFRQFAGLVGTSAALLHVTGCWTNDLTAEEGARRGRDRTVPIDGVESLASSGPITVGSGATEDGSVSLGAGDAIAAAGGASLTEASACAEIEVAAFRPTPVLEIVLDTSDSMSYPPSISDKTSPSKLSTTVQTLQVLVDNLAPETWLGIYRYPGVLAGPVECASGNEVVGLGALGLAGSAQRQRVMQGLAALDSAGTTPTLEALMSAMERLSIPEVAQARKSIVLVTDGAPSEPVSLCPTVGTTEQQLLQAIDVAKVYGFSTFVIGTPGSEFARPVLSQMAVRGETARVGCSDQGPAYCHYDMTGSSDFQGELQAALDQISRSATDCSYGLPEASSGPLDYDLINVRYYQGGSTPLDLVRRSPANCSEGWRYAGNSIELCPATCERVQTDPSARIQVLFGCETRVVIE